MQYPRFCDVVDEGTKFQWARTTKETTPPPMSDDDYEDGEILEEGEEPEVASVAANANGTAAEPTVAPAGPEPSGNDAKLPGNGVETSVLPPVAPPSRPSSTTSELLPAAPPRRASGHAAPPSGGYRTPSPSAYTAHSSGPRKRLHADMEGSSAYRNGGNDRNVPSRSSTPVPTQESEPRRREDAEYSDGMILRFPRQVVASNVLLNFGRWAEAFTNRSRKRLDADDLRDMLLNVVDGKASVSPFLMESLFPNKPAPTKVCVVLLGNLHSAVLQRHRPDLPFFNGCTSVPCMLSNANQDKRRESPLPQLLYRFPKPPVNTKDLSGEQLFYEHELTFLMAHSLGWSDEVILQPRGVFARKSQPQGGTWELDGDLLHLKWRLQRNKADEADGLVGDDDEDNDSFSLDVLVSEDPSMHYFITETVTDKTYAHETPDHMKTKRQRTDGDQPRQIRMSLVKATLANVPRDENGAVIRAKKPNSKSSGGEEVTREPFDVTSLTQEAYEEFVLSSDELAHHLFPVDVAVEQAALLKESKGASRDVFVKTQPCPESATRTSTLNVYALDCEMCETDIGMELTRVTVVNTLGEVVYDQLAKPQNTIINYHTQYSGITEEMLASTRCIVADVQRDLLDKFIFEDTILVGHSLTSDLRALRIVHLKIADTAILYPHERGFPFRASLKMLMKTYLGKDIQTKLQDGHDSAEDARAAMELLIQKIRRGPAYGIPEAGLSSTAYDSLPDKLAARKKRLAMLKYEHKLSGDWVVEEKKAWDLYASGHHQLRIHNPWDHAKQLKDKHTSSGDYSGECMADHPTIADASHSGFDSSALVESVKAASNRGDDVCWLEINQVSDQVSAKDFILHHSRWMQRQETYCDEVDALLRRLRDEAISEGTLMMVVPQGDLGLLRYVKALGTRSRWNDVTPEKEIVNELKDAMSDAFRGAWDGCAFFVQK